MNDVLVTDRRSRSSKTALIGDSQIPSALGQTITGALANIPFPFGIDPDTGEYGYRKAGADAVTPFKTNPLIDMDYSSSGWCVGAMATEDYLYNNTFLKSSCPGGYVIPLVGYTKLIVLPRSISVSYRIVNKDKTVSGVQNLGASSTLTLDILNTYHSIVFCAGGSKNWYGIQYKLLTE